MNRSTAPGKYIFTLTIEMSTGIITESTTTREVGDGLIPGDVPDTRMTFGMSVVDTCHD